VIWISFYKGSDWEISEKKLSEKFSNLEMYFTGRGFRIEKPEKVVNNVKVASVGRAKVVDTASEDEHLMAAEEGLKLAGQKLKDKPFLLVMDEVLNVVSEDLLKTEDLLSVLSVRGETHVVMTGRSNKRARQLLQEADLVTECKKIKHPYDDGKLAIKGLDF
jgi:cob(I)alamin adenosyltransferase